MKKYIAFIISLLLITGCTENTKEQDKSDYLAWKKELVSKKDFSSKEEINCDIEITIERIEEEIISYTTTISNPKSDMHNIKVLVVHNYFTEDVFPSVGIFDDKKELLTSEENNITLVGYIDTDVDIKKLNLELKIWIEYTDNDGNIKDIYYKTTK